MFFSHRVLETWCLLFNTAHLSATSHNPGAQEAHVSRTSYVGRLRARTPLKWGNNYFLFSPFEPQLKLLEIQHFEPTQIFLGYHIISSVSPTHLPSLSSLPPLFMSHLLILIHSAHVTYVGILIVKRISIK